MRLPALLDLPADVMTTSRPDRWLMRDCNNNIAVSLGPEEQNLRALARFSLAEGVMYGLTIRSPARGHKTVAAQHLAIQPGRSHPQCNPITSCSLIRWNGHACIFVASMMRFGDPDLNAR